MKKFNIRLILTADFDDIEAETEEQAFIIACEEAKRQDSWSWGYDIIDEEDTNDGTTYK